MSKNKAWLPQPTKKADAIEKLLPGRKEAILNKKCVFCNKEVTLDSFKNEISLKEFHMSGICQPCQDDFFKPQE